MGFLLLYKRMQKNIEFSCLEKNTSLIDCWQVNKYINLYTVGTILHEMSEYRFEILKIPKYTRIFYESDCHQIIVSDSVTLKLQMDL